MSLRRISVTTVVFLLFMHHLCGNPYRLRYGAAEIGTGTVCLTNPGFSGYFQNQALLAYNKTLTIGACYESRYNIKELSTSSLGVVVPTGSSSVGAIYSQYGTTDFRRIFGGIAIGMELGGKVAGGIQIDYIRENVYGEYDDNHAVTFEIGTAVRINEKTTLGANIFNPLPQQLRAQYLPSSVSMGIGSNITDKVFLGTEALLITGKKVIVKTGFQFEAIKNLMLRGGFSSENNSFCFGVGYSLKPVKIDFAFLAHESLGTSTSVSLVFSFK